MEYMKSFGVHAMDPVSLFKYKKLSVHRGTDINVRIKYANKIEDLKETLKILEYRKNRTFLFTESGEVSDGLITTETKEQTLQDVLGEDEKVMSMTLDRSNDATIKDRYSMDSFFERPVQIFETLLTLNAITPHYVLDVWDLYTKDPTVRSKLRNYAFLRGNLNLRITVSGTPFHYGRLLLSYQPYPERNENLIAHESSELLNPLWAPVFNNYLSQADGSITLNVNENKPIVMKCPFISMKDMHRLFNSSTTALAATTSYEDLATAGSLYIRRLNSIGAVSTNPTEVYLRVYAWMSEVTVSVPTATRIAIATESGEVDEREKGPVESFSSSLVNISNRLLDIPAIAPYATASNYFFRGLGALSAHFGWSKPVPIHEPSLVRNRGVTNGAQTIGYATAKRITLDPKQELTIDGDALARDKDDMTIGSIAMRRTYLTTFQWAGGSTVLWKCKVTPNLATLYTAGLQSHKQPTAMDFAATPFRYWRGDIEFRFEFVCSNYHRGKLAIIYEPNLNQSALISADYNTNKQCIMVVDLQETQTVDFCVNWASHRSWRQTQPWFAYDGNYGSTFSDGSDFETCNGYIYVYPFNELQSPDGDSIDVNVYVSCPNLRVNKFAESFPLNRTLPTESGEVTQPVTCLPLNPNEIESKYISLRHFGEEPISFRSLLKRYVKSKDFVFVTQNPGIVVEEFKFPNYPDIHVQYGNSVTSSLSGLYSYLRYAYVGVRGSTRFRYVFKNNRGTADRISTMIANLGDVEFASTTTVAEVPTINIDSNGGVMFPIQTSPVVDIEVPYLSNNKFSFSFANDLIGANPGAQMVAEWVKRHFIYFEKRGSVNDATEITGFFATGEDFSFMRFNGAPFYNARVL